MYPVQPTENTNTLSEKPCHDLLQGFRKGRSLVDLQLRKLRPLRLRLAGLYHCFDKGHAIDAVVNGGEVIGFLQLLAADLIADRIGCSQVDVGKRFNKTFRVGEGGCVSSSAQPYLDIRFRDGGSGVACPRT